MDLAPPPLLFVDDVQRRFVAALRAFAPAAPVLVLGHHDADGLGALALMTRALRSTGRTVQTRIVGRGENPWSREMAAELASMDIGGIVAADLGVRRGLLKAGTPLVVIDHHVPTCDAPEAAVISGYGRTPTPTSSLLSYWCAGAFADPDPWLWIAALGVIGDMAEGAGFSEMTLARKRYGISTLREAAALINAPRRSASGDASPALSLLLDAKGPKDLLSGSRPETAQLHRARDEVKQALEAAKRQAPKIQKGVALIRIHSPCQIHPLIAQQWRGRLKDQIVLAANTGYRDGWVHFAARTSRDVNLIAFLAEHAPPGADENYGSGHEQATGGALRNPDWNAFIGGLGFGVEARVQL